jgi:hypothetical protein
MLSATGNLLGTHGLPAPDDTAELDLPKLTMFLEPRQWDTMQMRVEKQKVAMEEHKAQQEIQQLQAQLQANPGDVALVGNFVQACCRQHQCSRAIEQVQALLQLPAGVPNRAAYVQTGELALEMSAWEVQRTELLRQKLGGGREKHWLPVERVDADALSLHDFFTRYANASRPVVITGAFKYMFEAEEETASGGEKNVQKAEAVAGAAWAQDGWRWLMPAYE